MPSPTPALSGGTNGIVNRKAEAVSPLTTYSTTKPIESERARASRHEEKFAFNFDQNSVHRTEVLRRDAIAVPAGVYWPKPMAQLIARQRLMQRTSKHGKEIKDLFCPKCQHESASRFATVVSGGVRHEGRGTNQGTTAPNKRPLARACLSIPVWCL
jgi:hypothetical protein